MKSIKHINDLYAMRPYRYQKKSWVTQRNEVGHEHPREIKERAFFTRSQWMEMDQTTISNFRRAAPITIKFSELGLKYEIKFDEWIPEKLTASTLTVEMVELPLCMSHLPVWELSKESSLVTCLVHLTEAALELGRDCDTQLLKAITTAEGVIKSTKDLFHVIREDMWSRYYFGPYLLLHPETLEDKVSEELVKLSRLDSPNIESLGVQDLKEQILIQNSPATARVVITISPIPVISKGVLTLVCSITPQVRSDNNGNSGIVLL